MTPPPARSRMPYWVPLLALPAFIPLLWTAIHAWSKGLIPTAFIGYDLAYYAANGKQFFTNGIHLTYGNPYAPYGTPAIYFQVHLFLLGLLQAIGFSPDIALIIFGALAAGFACMAAARFYQEWVGWGKPAHTLGFICFCWGGGALALLGACFGLASKTKLTQAVLSFDPSQGWWMLNFGRNLVMPMEAYYHGLFLVTLLFLIRRRFGWTLACAVLLSASHPFTGLTMALILVAYSALETLLRSGAASARLLLGSIAVLAAHLGYYLVFLNRFADHKALDQQWRLDWPYMFWTAVPALFLVGVLAFARLTHWVHLSNTFKEPRMRLALVWFLVVIGLTQHDLVIAPRQQIHFAHGYDWMALFFLATPALLPLIEKLLAMPRPALRALALAGFMFVFVSDNLLWMLSFSDPIAQKEAISVTHDERAVLNWLRDHGTPAAYVASDSRWINYLTPTYTSLRSWFGHDFNTPSAVQKKAEVNAAFNARNQPILTANPVYYVAKNQAQWIAPENAQQVYKNNSFTIWLAAGDAGIRRRAANKKGGSS